MKLEIVTIQRTKKRKLWKPRSLVKYVCVWRDFYPIQHHKFITTDSSSLIITNKSFISTGTTRNLKCTLINKYCRVWNPPSKRNAHFKYTSFFSASTAPIMPIFDLITFRYTNTVSMKPYTTPVTSNHKSPIINGGIFKNTTYFLCAVTMMR